MPRSLAARRCPHCGSAGASQPAPGAIVADADPWPYICCECDLVSWRAYNGRLTHGPYTRLDTYAAIRDAGGSPSDALIDRLDVRARRLQRSCPHRIVISNGSRYYRHYLCGSCEAPLMKDAPDGGIAEWRACRIYEACDWYKRHDRCSPLYATPPVRARGRMGV